MNAILKFLASTTPSLAKKYKRWQKKRTIRMKKKQLECKRPVDGDQLVAQLADAGMMAGANYFVQSSLSTIGPITGGARTVIQSLFKVIGSEGTLLMPSNTVKTSMLEFVSSTSCVDLRTAPSYLGVISEMFRTYPGVLRSTHPTHPVCGLGPNASRLFSDSTQATTPCGHHTPYIHLSEMADAYIVHLGSDFHQTTLAHTLEDIVENFPVKIYLDRNYTVDCIDTGGTKHSFTLKVHNPAVAKLRLDRTGKDYHTVPFFMLLKENSQITEFPFGNGTGLLFRAKDFLNCLERLLRLDITIYQ